MAEQVLILPLLCSKVFIILNSYTVIFENYVFAILIADVDGHSGDARSTCSICVNHFHFKNVEDVPCDIRNSRPNL